MRTLFEIRAEYHETLEKLYKLKTKAAKTKKREHLKKLFKEAAPVMKSVFKPGTKIVLDHEVLCSFVNGGGTSICGEVEVIDVYSDYFIVASGQWLFKINIIDDWKCWGKNSFFAFSSHPKAHGQLTEVQDLEHRLATCYKLMRRPLKIRNIKTGASERFRDNQGFMDRLLQAIHTAKLYKAELKELKGI